MWAGRTLNDANPAKDGEIFHSIADPAAPCYRGFWLACARGCRGHEGGAVLQGAAFRFSLSPDCPPGPHCVGLHLLRYLAGFGSPRCHLENPCHRGNDVHRQREDDGGILLRADLDQGLQVPQLDGHGLVLQDLSGHGEFLGGSVFSFSVDDFRPPLPLSLRLAGNGADHLLGEVHLFHLHQHYLHAPSRGLSIKNRLKAQA
jgi:hypothetical protein